MSLLRFLMLLSLVVWVGGIVFFASVVAPAVFSVLPTRHLAGLVVNRSLTLLHWMGVVSAGVFLICSFYHAYLATGNAQPFALRNLLVAGMLALTLASQLVVAPRMAALRVEMGEIDRVAPSDARRVEFNRLHQWSTRLEAVALLLGLLTLYWIAREWSLPAASARLTSLPTREAARSFRS
jgi:uncharacterized membrane protein